MMEEDVGGRGGGEAVWIGMITRASVPASAPVIGGDMIVARDVEEGDVMGTARTTEGAARRRLRDLIEKTSNAVADADTAGPTTRL